MRVLVAVYGLILLSWVLFQVRSLRRDHFPGGVIAAEALGGGLLILGVFGFGAGPALAGWLGGLLLPALIAVELALRVIGFRNAAADVELSSLENRAMAVVGVAVELALISPAIYLVASSMRPPIGGIGCSALCALAGAMGGAIGCLLPRFHGVARSDAEAKLLEWLRSPLEYGDPPDEIHPLDSRLRAWPGRDEKVLCSLFHLRYGQEWSVGFVGPYIFSLDTDPEKPAERLYEEFEAFYTETVLKVMERDAHREG